MHTWSGKTFIFITRKRILTMLVFVFVCVCVCLTIEMSFFFVQNGVIKNVQISIALIAHKLKTQTTVG